MKETAISFTITLANVLPPKGQTPTPRLLSIGYPIFI